MIHHGKWLISSDLNHRRCDNSMTVTRHKGGCVFVQRWNMPSTLKDATYRSIPLQIGENIKTPTKNKSVGFFCVFFGTKKNLSPLKSSILKEVQVPFARPKLGVISTHGGSKCKRPRRPRPWCSKRRNEHIRPVGSLQEERPREMDCNLVEDVEVFVEFVGVAGCCICSVVFFEYRIATVFGHGCFGLWFVLLRMGFVQLKVSWITRFTTSLASFDCSVFFFVCNPYLRMLQVIGQIELILELLI